MDVLDKLTILTDAAKYDAACTSSGGDRAAKRGYLGNTSASVLPQPAVSSSASMAASTIIMRFFIRFSLFFHSCSDVKTGQPAEKFPLFRTVWTAFSKFIVPGLSAFIQERFGKFNFNLLLFPAFFAAPPLTGV